MSKFVFLLLFVLVATITADIDLDGDGFFSDDPDPRFVDCCDTVHDGCSDPYMVNPGAYPFFGDSELNDCQNRDNYNYDNFCDRVGETTAGFTGPNVNFATTELLASAMDICNIIEDDDDPRYGFFRVNNMVIELANGEREGWDATPDASGPYDSQVSVLERFCEIFPRKENGGTMAALSTGSLCYENCGTTSNSLGSDIVQLPEEYLDHLAIFPEPGCNSKPNTVSDSVSMRFSMRQPSNADAFSFKTKVVSAQYQSYPPTSRCDRKDWFIALKNGTVGVPPDTNIALTERGEGFSNNVIIPSFWEWCDRWDFNGGFSFFSTDVPQTIDGEGDDDVYDGCRSHPNFDQRACFQLYYDYYGFFEIEPTFPFENDFDFDFDVDERKREIMNEEDSFLEELDFSEKYYNIKEKFSQKHPRDTAPREEEVFFGNEEKEQVNHQFKPRAEGEEIRAVADVRLGSTNTVEKVIVYIAIDHPFMSDLVIDLIGPTGLKVNLMTNNCELKYHYYYGYSRFFEVAFDMDAEDDIDNYLCDFYNYNYNYFGYGIEKIPLGDLNEFNGLQTDGEWTLVISDTVSNFDGTLLSFGVFVDPVDDDVDFIPEFCQNNNFEIDDDNFGDDDNCAYNGASTWSAWGTRAMPKEEFELKLIAYDTPTPFDDTIFLIDDYRPISEYKRHSDPFGYQATSDLALSRYELSGSNTFDIENPTDFRFFFTIKNWGPEDAEDITISFTPPFGTMFDMDTLSDVVSPFDECEVKLAESPYENSSFYKCRFSQARSLKPLNFFNGFLLLKPTDDIVVGDSLNFRLTVTSSSIDEDYSNNYKLNIVFVPPKFKFVNNDDEDDDDSS